MIIVYSCVHWPYARLLLTSLASLVDAANIDYLRGNGPGHLGTVDIIANIDHPRGTGPDHLMTESWHHRSPAQAWRR